MLLAETEAAAFDEQVATDHGTGHRILKAAMYNRLEELKEIVISEPRAVQEREVRILGLHLLRWSACHHKLVLSAVL